MNKSVNQIFLCAFGLALVFLPAACSDNEPDASPVSDCTESLDFVSAFFATRDDSDASGETEFPMEDINPDNDGDLDDVAYLLQDEIGEGSALFFTQLVSGALIPFEPISADNYPSRISDKFRERYEEGYNNFYTYYYQYKYPSGWDDQPNGLGGYNFFPKTLGEKMEWEDIQEWGYDNNGYALFAMYFPYDNRFNSDFRVASDQTDINNLRASNFIGAYHSSSSPGRLRFRLYHLMCFFKLTLYIPIFNDQDKDDKGNTIRTGYPADALQDVQLLDALTQFNINWYTNISSDHAPTTTATNLTDRSNIYMFIPPLYSEFYEESEGLPPIVTVPLSTFYSPSELEELYKDDPNPYDTCWKINVYAILPAGQNYDQNHPEFPGLTWTDKNFIRINMRQNIGEVPKSFVFNGNTDPVQGGHLTGNSRLNIVQGGLQHLSLYIPRHGAAAVLVGADIIDWVHTYNDKWGLNQQAPGFDPEN